jgi:hypothetical protein
MKMLLRRNFFCEPKELDPDALDWGPYFTRQLLGYGVSIADGTPNDVKAAAESGLGDLWLGCLH